jgi:hypothetical protein
VEVVILSQDDCSWCDDVKRAVTAAAAQHPVKVRVLDIGSAEGSAMGLSAGVMFPPAVFMDGRLLGYGHLSERWLGQEIERRLQTAV